MAIDRNGPGGRPDFSWRSLARPFRSARPGTMPAGLVLVIVVGALFVAMLGNADATQRKSDGKRGNADWRKSIAHDVAKVSDFLHLTTPRTKIDQAMGRQTNEKVGGNIDQLLAEQAAVNGQTDPAADDAAARAAVTPTIRTPTVDNPLRIWIGGDSVSQVLGQQTAKAAESTGLFKATLDGRVSTGLAVPSFFNWPEHFAKDVVPIGQPNPYDVMVLEFGANDGQNIQLDDGKVLDRFTPEWYAEYQDRVGKTMDLLKSPDNDRLILWAAPPPMGPDTKVHGQDKIGWIIWTEAQKRPWVHFVDLWPFFVDSNGKFQHSLPNADGTVKGMRQKDDVHFSDAGGARAAWVIIDQLKTLIDLSASKVPQDPPGQSAPTDVKQRDTIPESMPGAP